MTVPVEIGFERRLVVAHRVAIELPTAGLCPAGAVLPMRVSGHAEDVIG